MRLSRRVPAPLPASKIDEFPVTKSSFNGNDPTKSPLAPTPIKVSYKTVIGSKIKLKGLLSGSDDVIIEGQVEGRIELVEHGVTIGTQGVINANTKAKTVTIEGHINGNVEASELITVKNTSHIDGNLNAKRVNLEEGAKFHGVIDMSVQCYPPKTSIKSPPMISQKIPTP